MLDKLDKRRPSFSASQLDISMDRSASNLGNLDQLKGLQAILEPDNQHVTILVAGEPGHRPFKMRSKLKLLSHDASILQDTSQILDVSRDASVLDGDIVDVKPKQQPPANIFGKRDFSASPSSSPPSRHQPANIPPTPNLGQGASTGTFDFMADEPQNTSFSGQDFVQGPPEVAAENAND